MKKQPIKTTNKTQTGFKVSGDADEVQDFVENWNKKKQIKIKEVSLAIDERNYVGYLKVKYE